MAYIDYIGYIGYIGYVIDLKCGDGSNAIGLTMLGKTYQDQFFKFHGVRMMADGSNGFD